MQARNILCLVILFFAVVGQAEDRFMFGPQLMRVNTKIDGPTIGQSDVTDQFVDWKAIYEMEQFRFSATYTSFERTAAYGALSTTTERRTGIGAGIGFQESNFIIDLTYFFSAEWRVSDILSYKPGTGIGVELGYRDFISTLFWISATLNYKMFTFTKTLTPNDTVTEETTKVNTLVPMLGIGVYF